MAGSQIKAPASQVAAVVCFWEVVNSFTASSL